jgi:ATP-dependent Clp protease ATP-binding subunit ClpC
LLQVLDEGHLTDNSGRKINFKNTIIIMTSNIGSKDSQDFGMKIGFTNDPKNNDISQDVVNKSIKKFFKPEFLNRLDEVIHFNHLNADNILKIVDIQLNELRDRLLESNLTFKITKQVKEKLGELGYDKNYGARELNRVIQKYIENPMSEELLLNNNPTKGLFTITYDVKKEKINVALT